MPEAELSLMFLRPLNKLGVRYMVVGSVAAFLYGEPRFTNDVDLVAILGPEDIGRLREAFPAREFYLPPPEVIAAEMARPQKGHFNVIHAGTAYKADFYISGHDNLNAWAFRHARKLDYQGETIMVAPPEYVIVRKLEYFREGGSEKHLRDIRAMLNVSGDIIDRAALHEWVARQGVETEWEKASA